MRPANKHILSAFVVLVSLILALLILCTFSHAQSPYVTITGTVQGPNGLPLSNDVLSFSPTQSFWVAGSAGGGYGVTSLTCVAPLACTPTTIVNTGVLSASVCVGDSGSGGAAGTVPAPPAGAFAAGKYLSAGCTWAVPAGGGGGGTPGGSNGQLQINSSGSFGGITNTLGNPLVSQGAAVPAAFAQGATYVQLAATSQNWSQAGITTSCTAGSTCTLTLSSGVYGIDVTSGAGYQVYISDGANSEAVNVTGGTYCSRRRRNDCVRAELCSPVVRQLYR